MPFFNVSHIRELMTQGTPIYGLPRRKEYSPDDFQQYLSERTDSDDKRFPSISDILNGHTNLNVPENLKPVDDEDQDAGFYVGLSGDSLAFTLVYVSVFTLTLLYVGVRLARRWRKKQRSVQHATLSNITTDESSGSQPSLPPCGHPQCARVVRTTTLLPYTWMPAVQPIHNTAVCRGRCDSCRQLQQPPPSYTKLFLDDQPPAYTDSIVIKNETVENRELSTEIASENGLEIVNIEASNCDTSRNNSENTVVESPVISNDIIVEFNEFLDHEEEDLKDENEETPLTEEEKQ